MGLTVNIGLRRYFDGREEAQHCAALRALVEGGITKQVRDVFPAAGQTPRRIHEVRRLRGAIQAKWLPADEAAPILAEIDGLSSTYAAFAWHQLEALGVDFIQDLAVKCDGEITRPWAGVSFPGITRPVRVIDLSDSLRYNWQGMQHPEAKLAAKMHRVARKHRMVVHSA